MSAIRKIKAWARELKAQVLTLWFCRSHPDTPATAKILATILVAYAFSPIDLIPDFIPVLGYLDDLILVPLGIYLTLRLLGSVLHGEDREGSDLDLLVDSTAETSLFDLAGIELELERLLGVRVEVTTSGSLPESFRNSVLAEALPV